MREKDLINEFIRQTNLKGKFEIEKPLSRLTELNGKEIITHRINNAYSMRIDLLICCDDGTFWIIEAKLRLKPEALGQVLLYRDLFCDLYSVDPNIVKLGVIYNRDDFQIAKYFLKYGIKLFKI